MFSLSVVRLTTDAMPSRLPPLSPAVAGLPRDPDALQAEGIAEKSGERAVGIK
jgi:hypothetical protein